MCRVPEEAYSTFGVVGEWVVSKVEDGPAVEVGFEHFDDGVDGWAEVCEVFEDVFVCGWQG